jgi:hypothetical protein
MEYCYFSFNVILLLYIMTVLVLPHHYFRSTSTFMKCTTQLGVSDQHISTTEHRVPDQQTKIAIYLGLLAMRLCRPENNNFVQGLAINTENYVESISYCSS